MNEKMIKKQEESKTELVALKSEIKKLQKEVSQTNDLDHLSRLHRDLVEKVELAKSKEIWIESRAKLFKV